MAKLLAITAIIGTIITVAFGMIVGAAVLARTKDVTDAMNLSADANNTLTSMYSTIWTSFPLLPLVVLILIGGAILAAIAWFRV